MVETSLAENASESRSDRRKRFLEQLLDVLDGGQGKEDLFQQFPQEWHDMLHGEAHPTNFLNLLKEKDQTAWAVLLDWAEQAHPLWAELKEVSPFSECLMLTAGFFRVNGEERFVMANGLDIMNFLRSMVEPEKVENSYGYNYVVFLSINSKNCLAMYRPSAKSRE